VSGRHHAGRDHTHALFRRNHSVLLYQHFPRMPRDEFIGKRGTDLAQLTPGGQLWYFATPFTVFFLLIHAHHSARLTAAAKSTPKSWRPRFINGKPLSACGGEAGRRTG
jgi:hypothetical protein